jgi:nitrate reductase beta subunit
MWFNNVESKPGIGYPKKWEDQEVHRGGWEVKDDKLRLRAGGRVEKFAKIFHNPNLPHIDDYYEPWTYDYERLVSSPHRSSQPAARAKSLLTGDNMEIVWGPNWEDDLAGVTKTGSGDVNFRNLDYALYLQFKKVFMFYLPRICEHCLNAGCVASCPSGALYKRDEDGIVLVDQERCRGWRYCVSGCPYKKVYYNWKTGRSEKCLFCYPRIEAALPTLCAESCVGRIRYIGVILYDADKIKTAAAVPDDRKLYQAHLEMILNPHDPEVIGTALSYGIKESWIDAAQASPVYKLAVEWKIAFPPHPEFRTLPMVWYVPPLSPLVQASEGTKIWPQEPDAMRIPLTYLANLLTAGDETPVRMALGRLQAMRAYRRSIRIDKTPDLSVLEEAGMDASSADEMYRLLAIAKREDRYVIPTVKREDTDDLHKAQGEFGFPRA